MYFSYSNASLIGSYTEGLSIDIQYFYNLRKFAIIIFNNLTNLLQICFALKDPNWKFCVNNIQNSLIDFNCSQVFVILCCLNF